MRNQKNIILVFECSQSNIANHRIVHQSLNTKYPQCIQWYWLLYVHNGSFHWYYPIRKHTKNILFVFSMRTLWLYTCAWISSAAAAAFQKQFMFTALLTQRFAFSFSMAHQVFRCMTTFASNSSYFFSSFSMFSIQFNLCEFQEVTNCVYKIDWKFCFAKIK